MGRFLDMAAQSQGTPAMTHYPYATLAARFTDPADRDRFATVALGMRAADPAIPFHAVARAARSPVRPG